MQVPCDMIGLLHELFQLLRRVDDYSQRILLVIDGLDQLDSPHEVFFR
jgi:hypothetical protein